MTVDDDHAPHITKRRAADSKGKGKVQDNSGPVANSGSDSDDNEDWEAVEFDAVSVPSADLLPAAGDLDNTDNGHSDTNDNTPLSITIAAPPSSKQPGITKARRDQQSTLHHVHALALLMNGVYRNRLVDEEAVRAVALSLVPVHLVDGFRSRRVTSGAKRGTLSSASSSARGDASSDTTVATSSTTTVDALAVEFMARLQDLIDWFMAEFQVTANAACGEVEHTPQTEEALVACMAARRGCSSLVAMVFVAVCRALALETRLVVSLQPVACRVGQANTVERLRAAAMGVAVTRTAPKVATSNVPPASSTSPSEELAATEATEQASSHSATNSSTPPSRGRRRDKKPSPTALPPSRLLPPHTWIEVLYPLGRRWIPVDVLRARVNPDPKQMDPPRSSAFNTLVYAIAFEPCSDRVKDVTARYARDMRMLVKGFRGAGEMRTWLGDVVRQSLLFRRDLPRDVELDREEDAWLAERTDIAVSAAHQTTTDANGLVTTTPPTTISAYLNHPHYVLERHLKKYEYLHPRDPALIVGQIRTENIWPRSCVQMLHTSDKWLSLEARVVRFGEEPVKVVKSRVMPRKGGIRDLSRVDDEGDDMDASGSTPSVAPATVGLFGFWQTEPYTPQPVINGRIPKNAYNNVDLYRPSMLPSGAVHLTDSNLTRHLAPGLIDTLRAATVRLPSLKRLARKLDIDCAEAVVGFEYHGGRSVPTLDGVVVAEEHEEAMREAYCEQLFETMKKEADAREKEMVKRWETLVRKVVIGDRLKRKFGVTNEEQGKLTMEDHTSPSGKRVRI